MDRHDFSHDGIRNLYIPDFLMDERPVLMLTFCTHCLHRNHGIDLNCTILTSTTETEHN